MAWPLQDAILASDGGASVPRELLPFQHRGPLAWDLTETTPCLSCAACLRGEPKATVHPTAGPEEV